MNVRWTVIGCLLVWLVALITDVFFNQHTLSLIILGGAIILAVLSHHE